MVQIYSMCFIHYERKRFEEKILERGRNDEEVRKLDFSLAIEILHQELMKVSSNSKVCEIEREPENISRVQNGQIIIENSDSALGI
jgi:hypothetical protein